MFLDGCTWSQMRSLYTTTALLKCTPALLVFIMCLQQTQNLLFVLAPVTQKGFHNTLCIISLLELAYTNRNKKTAQFIHFWSPHCFGSPTTGWKSVFTFCAREVSLFLGIICTFFPPSTYFHWKFQILFTRGSLCLLKPKKSCFCPNCFPDTMQWSAGHLGSAFAGMTPPHCYWSGTGSQPPNTTHRCHAALDTAPGEHRAVLGAQGKPHIFVSWVWLQENFSIAHEAA